jgi:hypothetical protein
MSGGCRPLIEVLAAVPDRRGRRGRRHPLPALLAVACAATLCGARSYSAIAEWGRNAGEELTRALGFTHQTMPCAATFFLVFRGLDWRRFEAVLTDWAEEVLRAIAAPPGAVEAIALDGKTLRGSRKQGAPAVHLLSAVSHRLGVTLGQQAVEERTNEIPVAPILLRGLVLEGRVVTMDALLTQREIAQTILDGGGDYVMVAKGNQPRLEQDIADLFASPPPAATHPGTWRTPGMPAMAARSGVD